MLRFWQLAVVPLSVSLICAAPALADASATPVTNDTSDNVISLNQAPQQTKLKDSEEAIKQASELHKQAVERFNKNDVAQAIKLDEDAAKIAPHYWLPHAALAYLYYGTGGPSLKQASLSIRTEHAPVADENYAFLMSGMRLYGPAYQIFERTVAANPQSWRAKIGLAQCAAVLEKGDQSKTIFEELAGSQIKDPDALLAIAQGLAKAGEFDKAKEMYRSLLQLPASETTKAARILLFETAVQSDDLATVRELKDKVDQEIVGRQRGWLRFANVKLAETPVQARGVMQIIAGTERIGDKELRQYASVYETRAQAPGADKQAWLSVAKETLELAVKNFPDVAENAIQLAAIDEKLGDTKGAFKQITAHISADSTQDAYYRKTKAAARQNLISAFQKDSDGYRSYIEMVEYKIPKATCKCKLNSARAQVLQAPGVIDVVIAKGDKPVCAALFDSRKASRKSIFEDNTNVKQLKDTLEVVDGPKPIKTISELAAIFSRQDPNAMSPMPPNQKIVLQFPVGDQSVAKLSSDNQSSL